MPHILNIAEKPSVAKAISVILTGSNSPYGRQGKSQYNRIYEFDYNPSWGTTNSNNNTGNSNNTGNTIIYPYGTSKMHMTSVAGHLFEMEFAAPYEYVFYN